jgi:hypothetical protein
MLRQAQHDGYAGAPVVAFCVGVLGYKIGIIKGKNAFMMKLSVRSLNAGILFAF